MWGQDMPCFRKFLCRNNMILWFAVSFWGLRKIRQMVVKRFGISPRVIWRLIVQWNSKWEGLFGDQARSRANFRLPPSEFIHSLLDRGQLFGLRHVWYQKNGIEDSYQRCFNKHNLFWASSHNDLRDWVCFSSWILAMGLGFQEGFQDREATTAASYLCNCLFGTPECSTPNNDNNERRL